MLIAIFIRGFTDLCCDICDICVTFLFHFLNHFQFLNMKKLRKTFLCIKRLSHTHNSFIVTPNHTMIEMANIARVVFLGMAMMRIVFAQIFSLDCI